ncbi:MAG: hypothetical protein WCS17_12580 [Prevotella sp.]
MHHRAKRYAPSSRAVCTIQVINDYDPDKTPVWQADQNSALWGTEIVHYGVPKYCILVTMDYYHENQVFMIVT